MATLSIINSFSLDSLGVITEGKQGLASSVIGDEYDITVTGTCHFVKGTLATATVITVYDDDDDFPIDWDYGFVWSDQILYVQIIAGSTNVTHRIAAYQPFVLPGYDSILPAANSTLITGGTEPTLTDIDSIALGNYTGTSANYLVCLID